MRTTCTLPMRRTALGRPDRRTAILKIASVISAAEVGNVQAIHPGYGFLAENAHFNEICRSCKIDFIGPRPGGHGASGRQERGAGAGTRLRCADRARQ